MQVGKVFLCIMYHTKIVERFVLDTVIYYEVQEKQSITYVCFFFLSFSVDLGTLGFYNYLIHNPLSQVMFSAS